MVFENDPLVFCAAIDLPSWIQAASAIVAVVVAAALLFATRRYTELTAKLVALQELQFQPNIVVYGWPKMEDGAPVRDPSGMSSCQIIVANTGRGIARGVRVTLPKSELTFFPDDSDTAHVAERIFSTGFELPPGTSVEFAVRQSAQITQPVLVQSKGGLPLSFWVDPATVEGMISLLPQGSTEERHLREISRSLQVLGSYFRWSRGRTLAKELLGPRSE